MWYCKYAENVLPYIQGYDEANSNDSPLYKLNIGSYATEIFWFPESNKV